jgi:hypothetical protein
MIQFARQGHSLRQVAQRFGVAPTTVARWLKHSAGQRLDRVDLADAKRGPHRGPRRLSAPFEQQILQIRSDLKAGSDLGEFGAAAIRRELVAQGLAQPPSIRTIGRVIARHGAQHRRYRLRRPAPPPAWYLPEVARGRAELDSFDIIEGLALLGGDHFELFNAISLHGGRAGTHFTWPGHSARSVALALIEHWKTCGLPDFAQFDNDSRFEGPHSHPDVISRVMRLCLALGVIPVFAPPRETGFQAAIEHYNGLWQAKVWQRFHFDSRAAVTDQSARFVAARRVHLAVRIEAAPVRQPVPAGWQLDLQARPQGRIIFLRRTSEQGTAVLMGRRFAVDRHWQHRLVRCDLNLDEKLIRFHGLSRREPSYQPLLNRISYEVPHRRFHE